MCLARCWRWRRWSPNGLVRVVLESLRRWWRASWVWIRLRLWLLLWWWQQWLPSRGWSGRLWVLLLLWRRWWGWSIGLMMRLLRRAIHYLDLLLRKPWIRSRERWRWWPCGVSVRRRGWSLKRRWSLTKGRLLLLLWWRWRWRRSVRWKRLAENLSFVLLAIDLDVQGRRGRLDFGFKVLRRSDNHLVVDTEGVL